MRSKTTPVCLPVETHLFTLMCTQLYRAGATLAYAQAVSLLVTGKGRADVSLIEVYGGTPHGEVSNRSPGSERSSCCSPLTRCRTLSRTSPRSTLTTACASVYHLAAKLILLVFRFREIASFPPTTADGVLRATALSPAILTTYDAVICSIRASSSSLSVTAAAWALSSRCSILVTPAITEQTMSCESSHAMAS